jgi:hypothetical protein
VKSRETPSITCLAAIHTASATMTTTVATKINVWTLDMRHIVHRHLCTDPHEIKPGMKNCKYV